MKRIIWIICSVTRLGDLLDFVQVFKPLATINLPKSLTFLGNFYRHLVIFSGHTDYLDQDGILEKITSNFAWKRLIIDYLFDYLLIMISSLGIFQ